MNKNPRDEKGQSMVLIALLAVGLVAFMGLLVDGGRLYASRRQSQNASDAAAFAGARRLAIRTGNGPSDDAAVQALIFNLARANGVTNTATDVQAYYMYPSSQGPQVGLGTIPGGATGVRVYTTLRIQPFLISVLFGGGLVAAKTVATIQSGLMTTPEFIMPMTVEDQAFRYGQKYRLFGDATGPGNFQWIDFDGPDCHNPSEQQLEENLRQVNPSPVKEADPEGNYISEVDRLHWFCGGPGVKAAAADEVQWWLDKLEGQRHWIIPVYDVVTNNGSNLAYHIVSFAEFVVTGYDFGGQQGGDNCPDPRGGGEKCIVGTFQRFADLGHGDENKQCNTTGLDGCAIWLSE